ncbi:MAG: hypothetical protein DRH08_14685 [Deltaproteobacteria bacterium]|nr:MAG: hypothetical protein DRH08_14685 [Deltaproteobacteria bacterium]
MYLLYFDSFAVSLGGSFSGMILHAIMLFIVMCVTILIFRHAIAEICLDQIKKQGTIPFIFLAVLFPFSCILLGNVVIMMMMNFAFWVFASITIFETITILSLLLIGGGTTYKIYTLIRITKFKETLESL